MKTNRICKSTLSLLLVFMMLMSMLTVGIVNAGAAETDTAQTGVDYYTVYFTRPSSWTNNTNVYWWNSSVSCSWPGVEMTWQYNNSYGEGVYKGSVPADAKNLKFNEKNNDSNQTNDYNDLTSNKDGVQFYMDSSKNVVVSVEGTGANFGSSSSTTSEVYLAGSFNSWNTTADKFDTDGVTKTLTANTTYTFKVVKDGAWLGNGGTITDSVTGWTFESTLGDCTLTTTYAGDYVFTFDSSTNKLSVTYPTSSTTDPTEPDDSETVRIYVCDNCTSWEIEGDDANFFAKGNDGVVVKMNETVDSISGKVLWYADVASSNTTFTFYRASYFCDETNVSSNAWNTWTTAARSSNVCYNISGDSSGSWTSTTVKAADLSLSNFWYGLWVDTKGDLNTKTFVRAQVSGTNMNLYLPSYVNLSNIQLYSSFKSATITGGSYSTAKSLAQGAPTSVTLQTGVTYSLKTTNDNNSAVNYTLKVYTTSDTASMLMTTDEELYTGTIAALKDQSGDYKDAIETGGEYYFFTEDGTWLNDNTSEPKMTKIKKIKGRGNSTFKASMELYGKYAYNINLDKKVELIDGATKSKKWCLLANNPDVTMMRNTFIYSLADDVGLKYGPETRLIDLYDNGKYLGSYILTEKVEYGDDTLMDDMINLDDANEEANLDANDEYIFDEIAELTQTTGTYDGYTYQYSESGTTGYTYNTPENYQECNYLLEFELYDRYQAEASWFVSPRTGQAVVVKYPEFATQTEMQWIISEYEKAESAIYDYNTDFDKISEAVDVDSFARMYLIQELAINLDSAATSYYIHNEFQEDGTSKLVASPVWDYDWSLGGYMNKAATGMKYLYNGSTESLNTITLDNPEQMFVKNKALRTDEGHNAVKNYNFQAKLVQNSEVWERCQYYWTNLFVPNLARYVDNDYIDATPQADDGVTEGRMLSEWLPRFRSSLAMNDARWGSVTYTGDNWGTKITTNYDNRSFEFCVGENKAGSETKSYDNAVYYLNDWIVTRWNYMSGDGDLYDETIKETITADNADFTATQDGDQLTITPSVEIIYNGQNAHELWPESITYDIYVNGEKVESNTLNNTTTITLESGVESAIYIKAYLTNAPNTYAISDTKTYSYGIEGYKVENVDFTAEQHDGVVTVTPSATVTKDDVVIQNPNDIMYEVYLNNQLVVKETTFASGSSNVTIPEGQTSSIYIKVYPAGVPSVYGTSELKEFTYETVEMATATVYFKSSSSYRYAPNVSVDGGEVIALSKEGKTAFNKNSSQTQSYYWYEAEIQLPKDKASKLVFTNSYMMNATITVTADEVVEVYYFGCDNLNDGTVAVDLTEFNTTEGEYIKNFVKSATHMVYNDETDATIATTSIDGTIYKMGDANEDNSLNIMDATTMQLALAEKSELSDVGEDLADFNLDTQKSIMDVTQLQTFLVQ